MNQYQKVICIAKYLKNINDNIVKGNFDIQFNTDKSRIFIFKNDILIGSASYKFYSPVVYNIIQTIDDNIELITFTKPNKVSIDDKQFSTELKPDELFQLSLQYPVLNVLLNFKYKFSLLIDMEHIDELYDSVLEN